MSDNPEEQKSLTESQQWVGALCEVMGQDWHLKRNAGRAARLGKELRDAGGTVQELVDHFGQTDAGAAWWWYRDDWRGKRGQRPAACQIVELWNVWQRPIAVQQPTSAVGAMLAHIAEQERSSVRGS
jgi:hypothetical protein